MMIWHDLVFFQTPKPIMCKKIMHTFMDTCMFQRNLRRRACTSKTKDYLIFIIILRNKKL